ncbi:hypothetical protein F442_20529 [Phytophthora nicotianae P10297]|uniref:Ribonuclease H n=1 Tax=Phytophthora nicotianae P10297 TaxID=1317064 RepID=W2Y5V5_PHYNI|nr:hypothetical protein F442_20529 [Phytophthora nicotianae P10297]
MAKKDRFYAVARGKTPGVYTTWKAAERQVKGFSDASYEKFSSFAEAKNFMQEMNCREADIQLRDSGVVVAAPRDTQSQNILDVADVLNDTASLNLEEKPEAKTAGEDNPYHLVAFCSSSAIPNELPGGVAAYAVYFPLECTPIRALDVNAHPTNNHADCLAALQATSIADELDPKSQRPLSIHSRYQGLVYAMAAHDGRQRWIDNWLKNGWMTTDKTPIEHQDIYRKLLEAEKHRKISWHFLDETADPAWMMELHHKTHIEAERYARLKFHAAYNNVMKRDNAGASNNENKKK